jgi:hypothetical protein
MAVVEPITRRVLLRYLPRGTAAEVIDELEECINNWGTRPVVLRTDGGPPFGDSKEFHTWCDAQGIKPVAGIPYHSAGQGMVETRFRSIAASIIAVLGHKAPHDWWSGKTIARLEQIINSTICEPIAGSPYWASTGREPRTALSASLDYTSSDFGEQTVGLSAIMPNDVEEIIARHHDTINAIQGRVMIASSLAQAVTKHAWDASRVAPDFKVGDHVLLHRTAPNKMLPHFVGPFVVTSVTGEGNIVSGVHFIDGTTTMGPVHVARLVHFDASRATPKDVADFQLEPGSYIVEEVLDHRTMADGSRQYFVRWRGTPIQSWLAIADCPGGWPLVVVDYCKTRGLPPPNTSLKKGRSGR